MYKKTENLKMTVKACMSKMRSENYWKLGFDGERDELLRGKTCRRRKKTGKTYRRSPWASKMQ